MRLDGILNSVFDRLGFKNVMSEISAVFTDDANMRALNAKWRHIDKPTNVLSFPAFPLKPGEPPRHLLGDIVFALETLEREAHEQQKPFSHHLTHLMLHGVLHLLGFDHQTEEEAEVMERLEREILFTHAIPDPYQDNG